MEGYVAVDSTYCQKKIWIEPESLSRHSTLFSFADQDQRLEGRTKMRIPSPARNTRLEEKRRIRV